MQVDLRQKTKLTRIATQGQIGGKDRHVKQYALFYSDDGKKWNTYGTGSKAEEVIHLAARGECEHKSQDIIIIIIIIIIIVILEFRVS